MSYPNYTVYQNAAWAPARAVLSPAAAVGSGGQPPTLGALQQTDLTVAPSRCSPVASPTDAGARCPPARPCTSSATRQGGMAPAGRARPRSPRSRPSAGP